MRFVALRAYDDDRGVARALVVTIAVNVAVVLATPYFPFGDTANHLARYTLISRYWAGIAPSWIRFHVLPTGYIALDLVGAALVALTTPRAAIHILGAAYAILLPLGMYSLLRAVNPRSTVWALVGCLLTFNWYFLTGFLSYSFGIPLALFWLAWWWPRRNDTQLLTIIVGGAGIGVLYMVHMAAAVTALATVGASCVKPMIVDGHFRLSGWRRTIPRLLATIGYALPATGLYAFMKLNFPPSLNEQLIFRGPADKMRHVLTPFATFSPFETGVFVMLYLLAGSLYARHAYVERQGWSKWTITTLVLFLAYFVAPVFALNAWDVDVRFLIPAFLFIFVNPNPVPSAPRYVTALLTGACVLHAGITWKYSELISNRTAEIVSLLHKVPAGSNVLFLTPRDGEFYRTGAFTHTGEWLTIDRPSQRVNGLFVGGSNGAYLDHFTECHRLYDPGTYSTKAGMPNLLWDSVRRDYRFIVTVGGDTITTYNLLRVGATLTMRTTNAALFVVSDTIHSDSRVQHGPCDEEFEAFRGTQ